MEIIGHRGFKKRFPENTMLSFKAAAAYNIDGIECDVHWTKDRVPVIIHDADVDRTTNGTGKVSDYLWKDLQKLDAGISFGKEFQGEKIPSLSEIAEWLAATDLIFHLELKEQADTNSIDFVESIVKELKEKSIIHKTVISTFHHAYIYEVKKLEPLLETALLTKTPFRRGKNYASKVAADGIHIRHGVQASMYYGPWHKQGLTVRAYNVKRKQDFMRCRKAGVTGIITDDPQEMSSFQN